MRCANDATAMTSRIKIHRSDLSGESRRERTSTPFSRGYRRALPPPRLRHGVVNLGHHLAGRQQTMALVVRDEEVEAVTSVQYAMHIASAARTERPVPLGQRTTHVQHAVR